ncbi:hypothetical protein NLG97_g8521 [Lecanicillium saksenae]|uniref:Uncharacterized protein n=1 Tax=Lecanicillium saksenae TaxID=468837 RepID=A0ACC1QIT1_9HYPO|nr:hypothetical protein NLG97_g8521 [Lecanicillium saksenae]
MFSFWRRRWQGQATRRPPTNGPSDTLSPPSYQESSPCRAGWDPIFRRVAVNKIYSPFARLPDDILITIMTRMNLEEVLRLRHTSRVFMRLFSLHPCFKPLHLTAAQDEKRFHDTVRIWASPSAFYAGQQQSSRLKMCAACDKLRNRDLLGRELLPPMRFLYCAGCRTAHREMHFSQVQRREPSDHLRICIGHEGHFMLCKHVSLSLHQVKELADSQLQNTIRNGRQTANSAPSASAAQWIPSAPTAVTWAAGISRFGSLRWDEMRVFDPNVCDCVDWYDGSESRKKLYPIKTCPSRSVARCREETAGYDDLITTTGRCSFSRHGYTVNFAGTQLRVDVSRCHDPRSDMLVMRKTVDCVVDLAFASSPGWGDLICLKSIDFDHDEEMFGVTFCPSEGCAIRTLCGYDVQLRSLEKKQMLRDERRAGSSDNKKCPPYDARGFKITQNKD